eukprot:TRINITY_DN1167_c0_g2_i4.p1 TRINITY_DN1167_c0_g2~~TRINITY_DN1167_c0_g2_i4.p1  ORF type:complete len:113 (+),score=22.19 TRINITY_DN1167_c0_g2_i4:142-480(+)
MSGTLSKKSGNVVYYKAAPVVDEQMDGLVFISFIAGFASVILRNRIGLWISLFLILSSLVNLKKRAEYKQITMNLVMIVMGSVSYTHLRAHETGRNLVCRLLLEKKNFCPRF